MNEENSIFKILLKLIYLIDTKDNYTKNHSFNVCKYSLLLGKELDLNEEELKILEMSSLLHDVGKIGIPDYLLTKPSSLTDEEYELVKRHVKIGEALFPVNEYETIKSIIRAHHERIDGHGYPDGLKGTEIPYFSRIISIADTFDAMTTNRSYNKIKTSDEAFEELLKVSSKRINNAGEVVQQLDPHLVKIFISTIKKDEEIMADFNKRDLDILNNRYKKNKRK